MMSGSSWAWLNTPSPGLSSFLRSTVGLMLSLAADINLTSLSDSLPLLSFCTVGVTAISEISSLIISDNSGLGVTIGTSFSAPRLLFVTTLDTGSCKSSGNLSSAFSLVASPSDSEPEAELLSDGEEGDFFSCFSSFFFFLFFFLPACLLCFFDFVSPSAQSEMTSLLLSPFDTAWSPVAAAASLALALVILTGLCGGDSDSDSADSELLSFSPFLLFFFFLLLCFRCFLFFLWGSSFPSFVSSFSGASSSPEGMSMHSMVPLFLQFLCAAPVPHQILSSVYCISAGKAKRIKYPNMLTLKYANSSR